MAGKGAKLKSSFSLIPQGPLEYKLHQRISSTLEWIQPVVPSSPHPSPPCQSITGYRLPPQGAEEDLSSTAKQFPFNSGQFPGEEGSCELIAANIHSNHIRDIWAEYQQHPIHYYYMYKSHV